MKPAIALSHVDKELPLRTRAQSVKHSVLSLFRRRPQERTIHAARDVSLEVPKGQALGIVGANGAGKTTLLRLIAGISPPTRGEIRTEGRVLPLLELGAGFHPDLTGYGNIFLQGALLGLKRARIRELLPRIIEFADLESYIHMPVRHYSSGMYIRLGFAISIHLEPDVLLIDEAFSVGDLYFQQRCVSKMRDFHQRGGTYLLVAHDADLIQNTCEQAIWIDHGRIVAQGAAAEIVHEYKKATFALSHPRPDPLVHATQASSVQGGRYGSGAVTVDYLDLLDGQGSPCHSFENGRPMRIRARYSVHDAEELTRRTDGSMRLDIMLLLQSMRGQGVAAVWTRQSGQSPSLDPGGGEILLEIPRFDLAPGAYGMNAIFHSGAAVEVGEVYDFHARTYFFSVAPGPGLTEIAGLELPSEWEVEREAAG